MLNLLIKKSHIDVFALAKRADTLDSTSFQHDHSFIVYIYFKVYPRKYGSNGARSSVTYNTENSIHWSMRHKTQKALRPALFHESTISSSFFLSWLTRTYTLWKLNFPQMTYWFHKRHRNIFLLWESELHVKAEFLLRTQLVNVIRQILLFWWRTTNRTVRIYWITTK